MDYEKLWDDMNLEDIFGAPVHSVDSTPGSPWSTSVRSPGAESSVSVSSMRSEGAPTVNRVSAPGRSEITVSVYEEGLRRIGYGNVAGPSTKDHVVAVAEQIRKKQDLIRSFECGKLPELLEEIGIPGIQCVCRDCARKGKVMLEDELKDASSAVREGGLSDIARSKKRAPIDPDLAALQKLRLIDKLMGVSFKACLGIHRVLQDLNVSQFRVHKVREPHARRSTDLFGNGGFKPYPTPVLDAGRSVAATEGIRRRSVAQPSLQSETSVQRSRRKEVSVVRVPHNGGLLSKVTQGRTPTTTSPKVVERGPGRPPKLRDNRRQQLPTSTLLPAGAENSCPEVLDVDVVLREDHDGTVALPRDLEELFDDCLDSIKCNSSALASNCMRNAPSRKRLKPDTPLRRTTEVSSGSGQNFCGLSLPRRDYSSATNHSALMRTAPGSRTSSPEIEYQPPRSERPPLLHSLTMNLSSSISTRCFTGTPDFTSMDLAASDPMNLGGSLLCHASHTPCVSPKILDANCLGKDNSLGKDNPMVKPIFFESKGDLILEDGYIVIE